MCVGGEHLQDLQPPAVVSIVSAVRAARSLFSVSLLSFTAR